MESPQWSCSQPLIDPLFGDTTTVRAPAASSAFLGSVSSTRSTPSVAKIATFLPCNCCAAITPPCENLDHPPPTKGSTRRATIVAKLGYGCMRESPEFVG